MSRKMIPIMRVSDKPTTLDNYLHYLACFIGYMNIYANTVEFILHDILEKSGIKVRARRTLGFKIHRAHKHGAISDELFEKLKDFNDVWNICKHSIPLLSEDYETTPIKCPIDFDKITLWKKNVVHSFNKKEMENIHRNFTQIRKDLTRIHKKLVI